MSTARRASRVLFHGLWSAVCGLLLAGCGYTARPGLASYIRTIYVKPLENKIDLTALTSDSDHFPLYRPGMESNVTTAIINRFQFTGLLRPTGPDRADCRLEGELLDFRRDALRYDASQNVEEWRLSIIVNVWFTDLHTGQVTWEDERLTGDATYFATGTSAESEARALDRALQDLARRVVEHTLENW